jgi:4-carboxymuconolactone decarboxylase
MAYMKGVEPADASWFTRIVYRFVSRNIGKITGQERLIEPVKIAAHHPRLLRALGKMEAGQAAAHLVPSELKQLASPQAALLVGCPF